MDGCTVDPKLWNDQLNFDAEGLLVVPAACPGEPLPTAEHIIVPVKAEKVLPLQFCKMCLPRITRNTTS